MNQEPKIIQNSITPEVNSQNKEYIIYKTPFGSIQIFMFIMMIFVIIFSIIFLIAFTFIAKSYLVLLSLFFPLFICMMGFYFNSAYFILYNSSLKILILKKVKVFFCVKKSEIIPINNIETVILERYEVESNYYFKVHLILANKKIVTALDRDDEKGECKKALISLKRVLPEEVRFVGYTDY